jgi:hypothetical protein
MDIHISFDFIQFLAAFIFFVVGIWAFVEVIISLRRVRRLMDQLTHFNVGSIVNKLLACRKKS